MAESKKGRKKGKNVLGLSLEVDEIQLSNADDNWIVELEVDSFGALEDEEDMSPVEGADIEQEGPLTDALQTALQNAVTRLAPILIAGQRARFK